MKRVICVFIIICMAFGIYTWSSELADAWHVSHLQKSWDGPSVFTRQDVINRQLVYEAEKIYVFYNYKPLLQGHLLIIPKRAVIRLEDLTPEEWVEMKVVIAKMHEAFKKAYHAPDYLLVLLNGIFAGQTVPHVHFHMIPRSEQSIVITKLKLWQAFITESLGLRPVLPSEQLKKEIDALREYI